VGCFLGEKIGLENVGLREVREKPVFAVKFSITR
jgi:hypothetical protein